MSIANEIERLQQAKDNIKTSIINKGTDVPDTALISDFNTYVDKIATDTTATQDQIFNGQTAYINGEKVTGSGLATTTTATESTILSGYNAYDNSGTLITGTKGIVTGTVTATSETTLSISGLGFTPTNVIIVLETSVNLSNSGTRYIANVSCSDGTTWATMSGYSSYSYGYYSQYTASGIITTTFGDGTVSFSNSSSAYFYAGTYRYIAWN